MIKENIKNGEWIDGIPSPLVSPCLLCGCKVNFDYTVDDSFWTRIVPLEYKLGVICLKCLDTLATIKGENVCDHILNLYWCGDNKTLKLIPHSLFLYDKYIL